MVADLWKLSSDALMQIVGIFRLAGNVMHVVDLEIGKLPEALWVK